MYNNFKELNAAYPELNSEGGLTFEERIQYVQDCFDLYEKIGFLKQFRSRYSDSEDYDGQLFEVLRRVSYTDDDVDLEVLPMWVMRFRNGVVSYAFPEEICKAENDETSPRNDADDGKMEKGSPESSGHDLKKYDVFFVLCGYAQIEAGSEEEALQKASALGYSDISWNDMFETENAQPAEGN